MTLITAAIGQLSLKVIGFLSQKLSANEIVTVVRKPSKATNLVQLGVKVSEAIYERPETMERAFVSVQKLLPISSLTVNQGAEKHRSAIEAATFSLEYHEAVTMVLTKDGYLGKIYELARNEAFTTAELASEISNLDGKETPYRNVPLEDYAKWLVSCGFPEPLAQLSHQLRLLSLKVTC